MAAGPDLALSYLQRLHDSGYFARQHTADEGVWFTDHPACRDRATWNAVRDHLIGAGYLEIRRLPEDQVAALHPRDSLDAWWFVLTDKGRTHCAPPTPR